MQGPRLLSILSTFFLFTVFVAAWSWPDLSNFDKNGVLIARQNNNNNGNNNNNNNDNNGNAQSSATGSNQPQPTSSASASRSGSASNSPSGSGSVSATITSGTTRPSGSASGSISGSGSRAGNSTKTIAVDPLLPAGGVQMLTPAPLAGMTFVKVGDQVTFAWNYTSLQVPPSYIDVIATNQVNHQTYTIAANTSWDATQTVVWDTADYTASNSIPFVVASYTLIIYDSNNEPTSVPSAGYLGSYNNYVFGMYTKQAYVDLKDFKCASCNGAMSLHEKQALSVLLGTCTITILSFTWFASGLFGLF